MRSELIKLHNRLKTTIVYVTHDQVEAMTMGQLVVVMKDGLVQQSGEPLEIYRNPANRFVAEFIGSPAMNFVPAVLQSRGEQVAAVTQGFAIMLPNGRDAGEEGRKVQLGIRPEQLKLVRGPEEPADTVLIDGVVEVVEPLGAETIVEVSTPGGNLIARIGGERLPLVGAAVKLSADPKRFFVFDTISGKRLS